MREKKKVAENVISIYRSKVNDKSENLFAVCECERVESRKKPHLSVPVYGDYNRLCEWLENALISTVRNYFRADVDDGYRIEIKLYKTE